MSSNWTERSPFLAFPAIQGWYNRRSNPYFQKMRYLAWNMRPNPILHASAAASNVHLYLEPFPDTMPKQPDCKWAQRPDRIMLTLNVSNLDRAQADIKVLLEVAVPPSAETSNLTLSGSLTWRSRGWDTRLQHPAVPINSNGVWSGPAAPNSYTLCRSPRPTFLSRQRTMSWFSTSLGASTRTKALGK